MKYYEENMLFEGNKSRNAEEAEEFSTRDAAEDGGDNTELLGIRIRLGNSLIINNLRKLIALRGTPTEPAIELALQDYDIYTVTHAIGVTRLRGKAKVEELIYDAQVVDVPLAQTRGLLPDTKFKEVLSVNANIEGALTANGDLSAELPAEFGKMLLPDSIIPLGGDVKLNLTAKSSFIGKISCSIRLPLTVASGVSSTYCSWTLKPDLNPLLGDQLLVQTIAVPRGTQSIKYKMTGSLKADKGILWKTRELKTKAYEVEVRLNP